MKSKFQNSFETGSEGGDIEKLLKNSIKNSLVNNDWDDVSNQEEIQSKADSNNVLELSEFENDFWDKLENNVFQSYL